ncbi:MAG: type III secretion protein T [Lentisphaeria bacterium]|jgi:type III secretion protein T
MTDDFFRALTTLILGLPRIMMVLYVLPVLSSEMIFSTVFRYSLAIALLMVLFPVIYVQIPSGGIGIAAGIILAIKEVFVGLILGFFFSLPFWAITGVGFVIDRQRGSSSGATMLSITGMQTSPMGVLFVLSIAALFFVSGGFLVMLKSLYYSHEIWPIISPLPTLSLRSLDFIFDQFQWFLYAIVLIAAPVTILLFLIDLSMGLLNRFVPQINVFFLSMPIKSMCATFLLIVYIYSISGYFEAHFLKLYSIIVDFGSLF